MRILIVLGCALACYALPEVKIGGTTVHGRAVSDDVEFFGGIPFAEPPLGSLRLRKPILRTRLLTPFFNATSHGKACIQPFRNLATISEDCLTINIYRPANTRPSDKLPILFYTYGGGYLAGSGDENDGKDLVTRSIFRRTPVIYVSFNYRLGPLGFPQGQEADDLRSLNLALYDQIAALEWVQANIGFFAGDRKKVTVFGFSSGAIMTAVQYFNPKFGKLARATILQSGVANTLPLYTAARNEDVWQRFVGNVASCAGLAKSGRTFQCLRNATSEDIVAGFVSSIPEVDLPYAPTVDKRKGSVFPDFPSLLYARGRFSRIPFITGTSLDEGTLFVTREPQTTSQLKAFSTTSHSPSLTTEQELEETIDGILMRYPEDPSVGSPYRTGNETFGLPLSYKRQASLLGDNMFDAPRRQWNQVAAKFGVESFGYLFTDPQGTPDLGVPHGAEGPYVFGNASPERKSLSETMMDYWISFVVSLSPNDGMGSKRPHWPRYTADRETLLQLEDGNTTIINDNYRREQIDYLNRHSYILRR